MMSETDDEIRQRIELRYEKRQDLYKKVAGYVAINVILWLIFHDSWVFWAVLVIGFFSIVTNIVEYYNKYGGGAERREADIQREVERERARGLMYEKPKNDTQMRLTDDGELEEVPEDEDY